MQITITTRDGSRVQIQETAASATATAAPVMTIDAGGPSEKLLESLEQPSMMSPELTEQFVISDEEIAATQASVTGSAADEHQQRFHSLVI